MAGPHRVLILSAAIGEGHDLPARILAEQLQAEAPGTETKIIDGLAEMGWPLNTIIEKGSPFHSRWGSRIYDFEYLLVARWRPGRRATQAVMSAIGSRRLLRRIAAERPDVVVCTYPGVVPPLGRMRLRGRLDLPVVSAITDLSSLIHWAHAGIDLHLVTHPESVEEVRQLAGDVEVAPVRGLNSPAFLAPRDRLEARRDLGLPADPKLVVVSGGGWAVGDLEGAVDTALSQGAHAVALCGRNEPVREQLERAYADQPRVTVLGFTDRMSDLLAAADALVHSTAGLTVLEALVRGCPTISYGWGVAHIRANNKAFARFGLAEVATDRNQLAAALQRALANPREPDLSFAQLPSAASLVLDRVQRRNGG